MMTIETSPDLAARLAEIELQLGALVAEAQTARQSRQRWEELFEDVAPISSDVMAMVTQRLAEAEEKGYTGFARGGLRVVDRVMTGFDEDDLDQLGENVVLILETLKEMTQPEIMEMLQQTASAVQEQQHRIHGGVEETPSLWSLMKQMRDPEVRRGLARAMDLLKNMAPEHAGADGQQKGGE